MVNTKLPANWETRINYSEKPCHINEKGKMDMANNQVGQAVELTNKIMELVEGESPEVLQEMHTLLNYHMAMKAGVVDGSLSVKNVIAIVGPIQ